MKAVRIASLHVYPVKGMRGLTVSSARATALGLRGDRQWMVMREDGRSVTQRELPRMATIDASLVGDTLRLSAEGKGDIAVSPDAGKREHPLLAQVWRDRCEVISCGAEAGRWVTDALHAPWPCLLVRLRPGFKRDLARQDRLGAGISSVFADAAPYLVTSTESLAALNDALRARGLPAVGMERFRPNIVVEGFAAFEEQGCNSLCRSDGEWRLRYPSDRCIVITTDQRTGMRDGANEPFETLRRLNASAPPARAPLFGMNASWSGGDADITAGDLLDAHFGNSGIIEENNR